MADALSRKVGGSVTHLQVKRMQDLITLHSLNVDLRLGQEGALITTLQVRPVLRQRIQEVQGTDEKLAKIMEQIQQGVETPFSIQDGILMMGNRLCVPDKDDMRREILDEAYNAPYAIHPGTTKMYNTLKQHYWWPGLKKDVADFVSKCLTCQ